MRLISRRWLRLARPESMRTATPFDKLRAGLRAAAKRGDSPYLAVGSFVLATYACRQGAPSASTERRSGGRSHLAIPVTLRRVGWRAERPRMPRFTTDAC